MTSKTFCLILVFILFQGVAAAQPVILGLKIGAPLTDAFNIATVPSPFTSFTASADDYTLGPFIEVRLPLNLSIEGDALHRGYSFNIGLANMTSASSHASSWDFPIVAKYHFLKGPVKPYVEGGADFSHLSDITQALGPNHNSNFGIVLGAGVQLNLLVLRISPEIRYTGDTLKNFNGLLDSNRNQVAFLVGIGF